MTHHPIANEIRIQIVPSVDRPLEIACILAIDILNFRKML